MCDIKLEWGLFGARRKQREMGERPTHGNS